MVKLTKFEIAEKKYKEELALWKYFITLCMSLATVSWGLYEYGGNIAPKISTIVFYVVVLLGLWRIAYIYSVYDKEVDVLLKNI